MFASIGYEIGMIPARGAGLPPRARWGWRRPPDPFEPADDELTMAKNPFGDARSDAELIAACRERDALAWRTVVHRHGRLVYAVAASFRLQPADADEVFQLTFAALVRDLNRLREPERLAAWLATAARRIALRWQREERRRRAGAEWDDADTLAPAADAELERLRERERVRAALESLGEPCRTLLTSLFSNPPVRYRTLAGRLGVAVGTLGPLRSRCLARLRSNLDRGRPAARRSPLPPPVGGERAQ